MNLSTLIFGLILPAYTLAVLQINDTDKYPICMTNDECEAKNLDGHACFQYFCYPWKKQATLATEKPPLELCRTSKDCPKMQGGPAKCYRHYEKRKITSGICVPSIDTCETHEDCYAKGNKCCNGFCCNEEYFSALADLPCFTNLGCKVSKKFYLVIHLTLKKVFCF